MASRRLRRNKSLGGYLTSLDQTASNLNTRQDYLTTGLASQAVTASSLAEELSIFNRSIQSENYIEGFSGWRISGTGNAEFGGVIVRGEINAYSGTIGYWNISTPAVSRIIGPHTLLGTFIESSAAGGSDTDITSGTYVGLYKSYSPEPIVALSKNRTSNVSTITAENHQFEVGDYVIVTLEDDTTFNNSSVPVLVDATTNNTFSYSNAGTDVSESNATGVVQLYNPDVAGLYLRDYGKREFDYGYFSSAGVAYVSAEDMNIIENPSFEYKNSSNVISSSSTSWSVETGLTLKLDNFTSIASAVIPTQTPTGTTNITITTSAAHNIAVGEYVYISGVEPVGYNGYWITQTGTTGSTLVVNIGSNPGAIITAGTVDSARQYDYDSKYGARATWGSTGLSTYFNGKLDYAAGSAYSIFSVDRVLYFGTSIYPYYIPIPYNMSSVARYNLTGTFTAATSNATAITYTGTGLNFVAGQILTVTGFTPTSFNITAKKITSANATTVVVTQAGSVATATGTGSASVGLLELTTTTTHSFIADDAVFFDFKSGSSPDMATQLTPHLMPDGSYGYTYTVLAYPAPTTTKFYVSADYSYAALPSTVIYESNTNLDSTTRSQRFYKSHNYALDMTQIRLKYSNGNTTPLSNVVSVATKAQWDAGTNKYYLSTPDKYIPGYLDEGLGIPTMTKSDLVIIDADLLDFTYKTQDPTGYAAKSDITLQIPGWMYKHDGNGVVSLTKITSTASVGYILDNLYLATNNKSYYGNNLDTNHWYDNTLTNPAQASLEGTKTWIDINLATQNAQLNYLSRVGFKSENFSRVLYSNPYISPIDPETSIIVSYPESESLTFSSGEYQYLKDSSYYRKFKSYLQSSVGDNLTSFELVATDDDIDVSTGVISNNSYASVGGYVDAAQNKNSVVVHGNEFIYTVYDHVSSPNLYAIKANNDNVIINADLSVSSISTNDIQASQIRLTSTTDVNLTSTTHAFQIGADTTINIRIDGNEIQAANNGGSSTLNLNASGGPVALSNATGSVISSAIYNSAISSTRAVYVANSANGYVVGYLSSNRDSKQDINPAEFNINSILQIEPKSFKYKSDVEKMGNATPTTYGFIAEDLVDAGLEKVTYKNEDTGALEGINYSQYVVVLQAVVRDQAAKISNLESRIFALESK